MKAIYTRLSRDRSGLSTSTADQERECHAYLSGTEAELFTDNDVSASGTKPRPAYRRLLAEIREGRVDEVVCWSTDRLYRRPLDLEELIELQEQTRLKITALHSGLVDLSTPEGRAQARIGAAMNKAEVERLGDRVRRKKASLAGEGKPNGSRRPFGYDGSGMALDAEEATAYREAAEMALNGASLLSVVRLWNGRGLTGASGGAWTPNSVRRVLMSPRYAGRRVHQGRDVGRAAWPAIVTKRDHDRLARILSDPARKMGEPGPRYMLTGLLECGLCSGRMGGRPNNGEPGYVCKRTDRVHLGIKARPLEEYVARRASDLVLEAPTAVADPAKLAEPLLREREEVESRLERHGAEFARGEISEHAFRGLDRELSARIAELDAELEASAEAVPTHAYLGTIGEPTDDEGFYRDPETRAWLETLLEKVVVLPAERRGTTQARLEQRVELILRPGVRDHRS